MDMGFAVSRPLARHLRLVSGFCPSTRTFAIRFFQTPPRGGSPCVLASPSPPSGWAGDLHPQTAEHAQHTTTALTALGWRLGVRSDAFGPSTFWDAAAKADSAGLAAIEGIGTQRVSPEIARNLDYNLGGAEIAKVKTRLEELRLRMPAYRLEAVPADEAALR